MVNNSEFSYGGRLARFTRLSYCNHRLLLALQRSHSSMARCCTTGPIIRPDAGPFEQTARAFPAGACVAGHGPLKQAAAAFLREHVRAYRVCTCLSEGC